VGKLNILALNLDVAAIVVVEVANNDFVTLHDCDYTGTRSIFKQKKQLLDFLRKSSMF